ncbi:hypothetical protein [Sinorhizobium psoraleae]|uniref:hypothetical protein n=1 Tax=Sinorhizobium psoraleae TaxID=520838 RepID=UPI0015687E6C|nr:hypothetical protein [Sinorhizobium psoraleae]
MASALVRNEEGCEGDRVDESRERIHGRGLCVLSSSIRRLSPIAGFAAVPGGTASFLPAVNISIGGFCTPRRADGPLPNFALTHCFDCKNAFQAEKPAANLWRILKEGLS